MKIKITTIGTTPQELEKEIRFQFISVKEGIKKLADETTNTMRSIIQTNKKTKSTKNTLENAIKVYVEESSKNKELVGVGKIEELNKLSPYWAAVNFGASYMIPKSGRMYPKNASALRFVGRDGDIVYASSVKQRPQIISPMSYIEKTLFWLTTVIRIHFSGWTSQTKIR